MVVFVIVSKIGGIICIHACGLNMRNDLHVYGILASSDSKWMGRCMGNGFIWYGGIGTSETSHEADAALVLHLNTIGSTSGEKGYWGLAVSNNWPLAAALFIASMLVHSTST